MSDKDDVVLDFYSRGSRPAIRDAVEKIANMYEPRQPKDWIDEKTDFLLQMIRPTQGRIDFPVRLSVPVDLPEEEIDQITVAVKDWCKSYNTEIANAMLDGALRLLAPYGRAKRK